MTRSSQKSAERTPNVLAALPLSDAQWAAIKRRLRLAPQQQRIVELILRRLQDKQIAAEMGLALPTVRTYLNRIFARLHVADRMELVLVLFAMSHSIEIGG